jgi:hypothetical protein
MAVGYAYAGSDPRFSLWLGEKNWKEKRLTVDYSYIERINNRGELLLDAQLWRNAQYLWLENLISAGTGYSQIWAVDINDNGALVGTADYRDPSTPNAEPETKAVLLLPVVLGDIKADGDADDQFIESMPAKEENEPENAYIQRRWPNKHIAFIDPHRGPGGSPDMPRLVAKLPGGPEGLKVKWRLDVQYKRGNGYRASYVQDFTRSEDEVLIPWTDEMDANQEWRIFESQPW